MIELWETFLLQLDAGDEEMNQAFIAASNLPPGDHSKDHLQGESGDGNSVGGTTVVASEHDGQAAPLATATDVALEQDA